MEMVNENRKLSETNVMYKISESEWGDSQKDIQRSEEY
jgi:hypothetical protein